jgi:putative ABC transport system ATP-binding protein
MNDPILVFTDVAWGPPGRELPVFTGLDLTVATGEVVVLTSGLGGGKSSALRLAVGLEQPDSGRITVGGAAPADMRQRIGYVSGEGALLANLSLYDNLVLPLRWLRDPPASEVDARAKEVLALFSIDQLPPVAPAYAPTNLRRLVALARAMILDPDLLVLDDPAADFDADSAEELWQHLFDIAQAHGLGILAAATAPPRLRQARVLPLAGSATPTTRRFSSAQRRSAVLPALRPVQVHSDIVARKPT